MSEKLTPIEERQVFFEQNKHRLERMAFNATQKGLDPSEFVVVAIDVDDQSWTDLVDYLMPNYNWDEIRARGEKPVARGTVLKEITNYIIEVVPDVKPVVESVLPSGVIMGIVMASKGASIYHVIPDAHTENN